MRACKTFDEGVRIVQGQMAHNVDDLDQQIKAGVRLSMANCKLKMFRFLPLLLTSCDRQLLKESGH